MLVVLWSILYLHECWLIIIPPYTITATHNIMTMMMIMMRFASWWWWFGILSYDIGANFLYDKSILASEREWVTYWYAFDVLLPTKRSNLRPCVRSVLIVTRVVGLLYTWRLTGWMDWWNISLCSALRMTEWVSVSRQIQSNVRFGWISTTISFSKQTNTSHWSHN